MFDVARSPVPVASVHHKNRSIRYYAMASTIAVMAVANSAPAAAQFAPSPSLEPHRIEENFDQPIQARSEPIALETQKRVEQQPENAEEISFTLNAIEIVGATQFTDNMLLAEWPHQSGDTVTLSDIYDLAASITRIYIEDGYALSFAIVPQQKIDDGNVRIRVVEGFAEQVILAGPAIEQGRLGASEKAIRAYAEHISASRPLRSEELERYLLFINDIPGIEAGATLSPAENEIGGSVVTLDITRDEAAAELGYNNFLPAELDRHTVGGNLLLNGYLTGNDQIRLSALHSLTSNAYANVGGHVTVGIGSDGLSLGMGASKAWTRPSSKLLKALDYEGEAASARLSLAYPVIRSRSRNLLLTFGAEIDNSDIDVLATPFQRDRLRIAHGAVSYDFTSEDRSVTLFRLGVEKGLDIFDARGNSRANGSPTYTVVTLEAQREQPLGYAGNGAISLFANGFGQSTVEDALLSGAECGLGGRQFGRRFDAASVSGDHCALGSLELRWTLPVEASFTADPVGVQLYGFVDGGFVWQRGTLQPGERREDSGFSTGLGLRSSVGKSINAAIEASHQIKTPDSVNYGSDLRLTGSVGISF